MGRKKKTCPGRVKKKTYPHVEEGSLCHKPSNCNLLNLCGLYMSLAPEIVSWFLRFAESLAPPANSHAFGAHASRSIFLAPPALVFGVNCRCCYFQTPSNVHCMNAMASAQSPKFLRIFYPQTIFANFCG